MGIVNVCGLNRDPLPAIGTIIFILLFILHFVTKVENRSIILEGLWTARKVKIDISSILTSEKVMYSKFIFNRGVYNLHRKGRIHFYTYGRDAVQLTDKDGLIYIIGSQRADELNKIINSLSKLMNIDKNIINLKGKTVEKLGLIGKENAIACEAIVSINKYE